MSCWRSAALTLQADRPIEPAHLFLAERPVLPWRESGQAERPDGGPDQAADWRADRVEQASDLAVAALQHDHFDHAAAAGAAHDPGPLGPGRAVVELDAAAQPGQRVGGELLDLGQVPLLDAEARGG